jgi:hypothetical protein
MSYGKLINGMKYIYTHNGYTELKKQSLEDYTYFTLREIFWNADHVDTCIEANRFNGRLTNDIYFEIRTDSFQYTNVLYQESEIKCLINWLSYFTPHGCFEFTELEEDFVKEDYILFDDWWKQLEELKEKLMVHKNTITTNSN